ncbi:MAG TPA: recombinase family protein [Verrucomicrobiae bacterium]|nr:recombinase family protein [Verrucomicrobiae bacterium]
MPNPPPHPNANVAVIYGRVSTSFDRQGRSIEAQDPRLRAYCQRRGLAIGEDRAGQPLAYFDEESGTIPIARRAGGALVCRALTDGLASHVIFTSVDRLGRRVSQMTAFTDWCEGRGVTIHAVDEVGEIDFTSIHGRMMFQLLCMFAENQQRTIVRNIQKVFDEKRANNELCGTVPYGYRAVPTGRHKLRGETRVEIKTLEEDPAQQHWLRQMLAWKAEGMSYPAIARQLNALGVPAKTPKGTPFKDRHGNQRLSSGEWSQGNVHHVLHNSYTRALAATLGDDKLAA